MAQETDKGVAREPDRETRASSRLEALRARALRAGPWLVPSVIAMGLLVPAWLDVRVGSAGRARAGLSVLGKEVEGRDLAELERELAERARELVKRKLALRVADKRFELEPPTLSARIDARASVERVRGAGHDGSFVSRLAGYWRRRFSPVDVPLVATLDRGKLAVAIDRFETAALTGRPFFGGIDVSPAGVKTLLPKGGTVVDRARAEALVLSALV
jgi:hypothetical protein